VKPIFFENSRIPVWLSKLAPIEINAISIGVVVFSRGVMSEQTKRHETIHFHQWVELGFIGFIVIYLYDYIHGLYLYRDPKKAYARIRAEQEAYDNDIDPSYIDKRRRYSWIKQYSVKDSDHY
jgi:hypothetical protein